MPGALTVDASSAVLRIDVVGILNGPALRRGLLGGILSIATSRSAEIAEFAEFARLGRCRSPGLIVTDLGSVGPVSTFRTRRGISAISAISAAHVDHAPPNPQPGLAGPFEAQTHGDSSAPATQGEAECLCTGFLRCAEVDPGLRAACRLLPR